MHIIGYAYEADLHCPTCTQFAVLRMKLDHSHPHAVGESSPDSFGIEHDTADREGNLIHPVFNTDELHPDGEFCGDCGLPL